MRVGIIGCGNVSLNLHLPALAAEPSIEVVAAADPTPARLELFRERAGLDASACTPDAAGVLARPDVEAVLVATPPRYRPPIVLDALAAGKHVLSEKPIALTPAEGWEMARAARAADRRLAMVHNYYFMPDLAAVKRVLDSGAIGQPYLVMLNLLSVEDRPGAAEYQPIWRHDALMGGGGVLMDIIHAMYIVAWLSGGQAIRAVSAVVDRRVAPLSGVEDVALCRFEFDKGFGLVNMAWGDGPGGVEIMGSDGRLLLFYRSFGTGAFEPPEQLHVFRGKQRVPVEFQPEPGPRLGMQPIWRDFADSIERGREPIAPAEQGCQTLEAVLASYASAARKCTVALPLDTSDPVYYRGIGALWASEPGAEEVSVPNVEPVG
jgi:predicted dehydrogenase